MTRRAASELDEHDDPRCGVCGEVCDSSSGLAFDGWHDHGDGPAHDRCDAPTGCPGCHAGCGDCP